MITPRQIVAAFGGGDILSNGNVNVAAPGHSRRDRSLSIKPTPDGVLVNTFSPRDDRLAMFRYVSERLGISGRSARSSSPWSRPTPPPSAPTTTFDPLPLWNACLDPANTPAAAYLARRGVLEAAKAAFGHALRYRHVFPFGGKQVPCMIALVTDICTGKPQAIHRTALDLAGHKIKVDGEDRFSKGPTKGGCKCHQLPRHRRRH